MQCIINAMCLFTLYKPSPVVQHILTFIYYHISEKDYPITPDISDRGCVHFAPPHHTHTTQHTHTHTHTRFSLRKVVFGKFHS